MIQSENIICRKHNSLKLQYHIYKDNIYANNTIPESVLTIDKGSNIKNSCDLF